MSRKCYSRTLKAKLNNIIAEMETTSSLFSVRPEKDFTRKRTLPLSELMTIVLSMAGNSLNKELYDYFKHTGKSATASAFVQQRAKLLPEAFEYLFHEFNEQCNDAKTYKGYHLYAVDGSDVNIAKNPDSDSYIKLNKDEYGNILHINALYDLLNKTYVDAIIQQKAKTNEARAAVDMVTRRSINTKTILLADRGYGAMNLTEHIKRTENLEYLIRVKNDYIKEISELPL